jgi:hypothetical protein
VKKKFREDYLEVGVLEIDPRVERPEDAHKVNAIEKDFDEDALGVLTISHRINPEEWIILDGQHRRKAALLRHGGTYLVPCHVYEDLTLKEEADLFLKLNYTTKPKVIDKFPIRVTRGDKAAIEIKEMLRQYGWTISNTPGDGVVNAIAAVERIYDLSEKVEAEPNLVQATILVVSRAWGIDRYGVQGAVFEGLGRLLAEHGSRIELDRLIDKLKSWPNGAYGLHNQATAFAKLRRGKVTMAVAELVTDEYNKGRRSNQLPVWKKRA